MSRLDFLKNKVSVTLVCFLAYFIMSGLLTQMGVVSLGLQTAFRVSSAAAISIFTWLLTGVLVGTITSNFIYQYFSLKQVFLICYIPLSLMITGYTWVTDLFILQWLLFFSGTFIGLGLATATVTLTRLYDGNLRASMLVCTSLSFSLAGVLIPTSTAMLIEKGFAWFSGYLIVAGVVVLCIILVAIHRFPELEVLEKKTLVSDNEKLCIKVWLLAFTMFFFLFGQSSFFLWAPSFVVEKYQSTIERGGDAIGLFWMSAVPGQLLAIFLLARNHIALDKFLLIVTPLAAVSTWLLVSSDSLTVFMFSSGIYGFVLLPAHKSIIAYVSLLNRSPKAITVLLSAGTAGSMFAPVASSWIYNRLGIQTTMLTTSVSATCVAVTIGLTFLLVKHRSCRGRLPRLP
ncbi:MFS transporter TsgA [Vibrio parahaemolyticus]|nr:MFS transporter TsgA [Vibrio parahaemolyticus]